MAALPNGTAPSSGVNALGGDLGTMFDSLAMAGAKIKQAVWAGAGTFLNRAGDFASTKVLAKHRRGWNATLGRFFGDIFIYLDGRGGMAPSPSSSKMS
jgi:hypothetical protein